MGSGMSPDEMKQMLRDYRWNVVHRKLDAAMEYIDDSIVDHSAQMAGAQGKDAGRKLFESFYAAFPDFWIEVNDIIVEGDLLSTRASFTGTHEDTFQGIPATHKKFSTNGIEVFRIQDRKFVERWFWFDTARMMQQLGLM